MPYFGRMYNRQILRILFRWFPGSYKSNNSFIITFALFFVLQNINVKIRRLRLLLLQYLCHELAKQ